MSSSNSNSSCRMRISVIFSGVSASSLFGTRFLKVSVYSASVVICHLRQSSIPGASLVARLSRRHDRGPAAVDRKRDATDPARVGGSEERDCGGDVPCLAEPSQRIDRGRLPKPLGHGPDLGTGVDIEMLITGRRI